MSDSVRFRECAIDAGRWIDTIDPGTTDATLYAGTAGRMLFQLELHRLTGEAKYMRAASAGADALLAGLRNERDAGLYDGIAGTGFALGAAYRATREVRYHDGCLHVVRWLQDHARRIDSGIEWNERADIYDGLSGTGLFLLWAAREFDAPGARDLAVAAGRRAIAAARQTSSMPNFSHGTAGIAYFLATLYRDARQQECLGAAVAAARQLQSIAATDGDQCRIYHDDSPAGKSLYYLGWCHGPAGTARLFYRLWQTTGDSEWMVWVERCARAVCAVAAGTVVTPGAWDNVSVCCGVAGQAKFLLDCYAVSRTPEYLDAATERAMFLVTKAVRDAHGARWLQAEHRTQPDVIAAHTGYMQGASGIGTCLLHLSRPDRVHDVVRLPDDPFGP